MKKQNTAPYSAEMYPLIFSLTTWNIYPGSLSAFTFKCKGNFRVMLLFLLTFILFLWLQHYFEQGFTSKPFGLQMSMTWYLNYPSAKHPSWEMVIHFFFVSVITWFKAFPCHSSRITIHPRKETAGRKSWALLYDDIQSRKSPTGSP